MRKNYNRHPIGYKSFIFCIERKIISEDVFSFYKTYNIQGVIQILPKDFKLIKKNMKRFTHFNIQKSSHKAGKKYMIIKIHKPGYFDGNNFRQAIYSDQFILAKCLSSKNHIDYKDLNKTCFKYSLSNIKNVEDLKKTIIRRYKNSLAHLSKQDKMSLGVATTELKLIKRLF